MLLRYHHANLVSLLHTLLGCSTFFNYSPTPIFYAFYNFENNSFCLFLYFSINNLGANIASRSSALFWHKIYCCSQICSSCRSLASTTCSHIFMLYLISFMSLQLLQLYTFLFLKKIGIKNYFSTHAASFHLQKS